MARRKPARPESLDLVAARRLALAATGLDRVPAGAPEETAVAVFRRLGSVQIDTINVVERAHHHIIWSRSPTWRPEILGHLETGPRRVFEYWSHAAAYLPIEAWRYCLPRMERMRALGHPWFEADPATVAEVRKRIEAEGALTTSHWEDGRGKGAGWWDWKPAKIALEYLFHSGEIMTVTRNGFRKLYDLTERVLPPGIDRTSPEAEEMASWHLDNAVASLGLFARRDIAYHREDGLEGIDAGLDRRLESGELLALELEVEGRTDDDRAAREGRYFVRPADLEEATRSRAAAQARTIVLSPLDPLVIDRRRFRRLFGVDYQMECYLPEAKRRYGYFALPLLSVNENGDPKVAGLVDAKMERKERLLRIKRLILWDEKPPRGSGRAGAAARSARAASLARGLADYAAWQGAEDILIERLDAEDPVLARLVTTGIASLARRGL